MSENKIEIFQSSNGEIEFKGDVNAETIWANQKQISQLFGTKVPAITKHIKNILDDEELDISTISKMETVQIADIFEKDRTVITRHINNVLKDKEIYEKSNVQKMYIASSDKSFNNFNTFSDK